MSRGRAWPMLREHAATLAAVAAHVRDEEIDLQIRAVRGVPIPQHIEAVGEPGAIEALIRCAGALQAFVTVTASDEWPTVLEMDRAIVHYRERGDHAGVRLVSALRRLTSVMAEATVRALPPAEEAHDAP